MQAEPTRRCTWKIWLSWNLAMFPAILPVIVVPEQENWLSVTVAWASCSLTASGWGSDEKSTELVPLATLRMPFLTMHSFPLNQLS